MSTAPHLWKRLLRLRRNLERQEELKLASAARQHNTAAAALQSARVAAHGERADLLQRMRTGVSGAELEVAAAQHDMAQTRQRRLETDVATLGEKRDRQRTVLAARTREREILESVEARHAARRLRDQSRRDQLRLDESHLLQKSHSAPPSPE